MNGWLTATFMIVFPTNTAFFLAIYFTINEYFNKDGREPLCKGVSTAKAWKHGLRSSVKHDCCEKWTN